MCVHADISGAGQRLALFLWVGPRSIISRAGWNQAQFASEDQAPCSTYGLNRHRSVPSQIRALTDPWWTAEVFERGVGMGGLHSGVAVDDSRLVWLDLHFWKGARLDTSDVAPGASGAGNQPSDRGLARLASD